MYYATAKEMEKLDILAAKNGLEIRQMMELAGWHILSVFQNLNISKNSKVVVITGKGNKGGDGLAAARQLTNYGWKAETIILDRKISPDAKHQLNLLQKMKVPVLWYKEDRERARIKIKESDIIIDALIGYHLDGSPRGVFKEVIELVNGGGKKIISYDIPSGIDASTGECLLPCLKAFATLALALPKKAFQSEQAKEKSGTIFIADIGIPRFLYDMIAKNSRPDFEKFENFLIKLGKI